MENGWIAPDVKTENMTLWLQKLSGTLMHALVITGAPVIALGVYELISQELYWEIPQRLGVYLALVVAAFWPRISYRIQIGTMIAVFGIFGLYNFTLYGFNSESALFLLVAAFLASLFFNRWVGYGVLGALCLGIVGIGWAFSAKKVIVYCAGTFILRNTDFASWALLAFGLLALGSGVQYAQNYIFKRLLDALQENYTLTQVLESERTGLAELVALRTTAAETSRAEAESAIAALQDQMWQITGLAQVNAVLRGEPDLPTLAHAVIGAVCRYLEAPVGALYLREDDHVDLLGRYAYTPTPGQPERFYLGEGLVGQAAREGRVRVLADIPETQLVVTSGLGQSPLRHLLVAPFQYVGTVQGVLELGALHPFTPAQVQFIEQVLEPIAIAFNSAQSRARIHTLLEETQRQADELTVREEELRAINEELQAQAESLQEAKDQQYGS